MHIPPVHIEASPPAHTAWPMLPIAALLMAIVAVVSWKLLSAPTLRVTPDAARVWMTELDTSILKRTTGAGDEDEGPVVMAHPGRPLDEAHPLEPLHRAAQQAAQVRQVLLAPASIRFQKDLITDIGTLSTALDHCGERRCADVIARLRVLTAARADSVVAFTALHDLHACSVVRVRRGRADLRQAELLHADSEALDTLLRGGYADVDHYSNALWEVIEIHREMTEAYAREHRFVMLLQRLYN